jgi:hypothetical protein
VTPAAGLGRDGVILACAASAGIHGALVRDHLAEGVAAGVGFIAATCLLAAAAVALTLRPAGTAPLVAAAALLAGLLAAFAASVTTGVPVLHPNPEPFDGLALATKAIEAVGLLAAWRLLRPHGPRSSAPAPKSSAPAPKGTPS